MHAAYLGSIPDTHIASPSSIGVISELRTIIMYSPVYPPQKKTIKRHKVNHQELPEGETYRLSFATVLHSLGEDLAVYSQQ